MTSRRRTLLAVLAATAMLLSTAGCSFWPKPPADLVAAAHAYADEARSLVGVAEAHADVTDVDVKDKPGEWRVSLYVTASDVDELDTVPDAISGLRPPESSVTYIQVNIPGGPGLAPVTLADPEEGSVERAETLRALPFVSSVTVSREVTSNDVRLAAGTPLAVAIAGVRSSGTLSPDPLDSVTVSRDDIRVAVSLAGPSDALVGLIEKFGSQPGVRSLVSSEPTEFIARPSVRASTDHPAGLAAALSQLVGDQRDGRPRTSFSVSSDTESRSGYVGLPLGSPTPDDIPVPTRPPVDEVALAAQLAEDTQAVTDFLSAAAQASGIPGTPEVFVTECSNARSQVQGDLLLPVFDYADTADPAYDAITSAWERAG